MKNNHGITFIEILIVCSIIIALSAITIGGAISSRKKSLKARTLTQMDQIAAGLQAYANDFGSYPPDNSIEGAAALDEACLWYYLGATFHKGANSEINAGPYLDFDADDYTTGIGLADFQGDGVSNDAKQELTDAWGNEYNYQFNTGTPTNINSYDLWSNGPDGTSGTSDDVTNWS